MPRFGNILDPVHDSLSPKVWDDAEAYEPKLKPHIADFIKHTIYHALESNGYARPKQWLHLVLTGSLTTYQYSDDSDCDISLFIDSEVFPEWSRAELIGIMIDKCDGTKVPGSPFVLQDFVVPSHIKAADLYRPGLRSGWDIDQQRWITPPERDRVHDVKAQENGFYVYALEQADKMERLLRYDPEKAKVFWHQIHERRRNDMAKDKGDFCLAPQTRVLTDTYEWVPLMEVEEGDVLVGFDEETPGGVQRGKQRTLQRTVVTSLESKCLPSYRVLTDLNEPVIASAQHMWLVRGAKRCLAWKKTEALVEGDRIIRFGATWDEANDQNEANYLAGLMDGEGHLTATGRLCFTQKEGLVLERAKLAFDRLGFRYGVYNKQHLDDYYDLASALQVHGGVAETMRFLHQIPSVRLRVQRPNFWLDREISPKGRYVVPDGGIATVQGVEFVGDHEVIAVGTTTKTLIAEGLFSHNSESNVVYKFLANRNLFPQLSELTGEYLASASPHGSSSTVPFSTRVAYDAWWSGEQEPVTVYRGLHLGQTDEQGLAALRAHPLQYWQAHGMHQQDPGSHWTADLGMAREYALNRMGEWYENDPNEHQPYAHGVVLQAQVHPNRLEAPYDEMAGEEDQEAMLHDAQFSDLTDIYGVHEKPDGGTARWHQTIPQISSDGFGYNPMGEEPIDQPLTPLPETTQGYDPGYDPMGEEPLDQSMIHRLTSTAEELGWI